MKISQKAMQKIPLKKDYSTLPIEDEELLEQA
jgi:hypothetical protein